MGDLPLPLPLFRGGCTCGPGMRWFERLVEAAHRHGASVIRVRTGERFTFRIRGETQILGTHPVQEADLLERLCEVLPQEFSAIVATGVACEFEYVVVPWAPVSADTFRGPRGFVLSVRLTPQDEADDEAEKTADAPPAPGAGELVLTPSVTEIDRILRAGFAAGASQILITPAAPLTLRIGSELVRVTEHALAPDFVRDLAESLLDPAERQLLREGGDVELEMGVPPWAPCAASVFLAGGRPHVVIQLPVANVERPPAPPPPASEDIRRPSPRATEEGAMAEIIDCLNQANAKCIEAADEMTRLGQVHAELRLRQAAVIEGIRKAAELGRRLEEAVVEIRELTRDLRPSLGLNALRARLTQATTVLAEALTDRPDKPPDLDEGRPGVHALLPRNPPGRPGPALRARPPESP